jgi:hypothetical protein
MMNIDLFNVKVASITFFQRFIGESASLGQVEDVQCDETAKHAQFSFKWRVK